MQQGYAAVPNQVVQTPMSSLEQAIGNLSDTLDRMESRIAPFIRPQGPENKESTAPSQIRPTCSTVREQVDSAIGRLHHLSDRVASITERFDV